MRIVSILLQKFAVSAYRGADINVVFDVKPFGHAGFFVQ